MLWIGEAASSFGSDIDFLFELILWIVGGWFIATEAVFFYFIIKFRKKEGVKAQYIAGEEHHEAKWVHWPHYSVIAFDVVIIVYTVMIWADIKQTLPQADETIRVIGQQWTWIFVHPGADGQLDTEDDIATVNDLHMKVGKTYHIKMESKDVLHDFSVPAFRFKQDVIPGRIITGWVKPIREGKFDVQCAEMCGIGHGIMAAQVTVQSENEYNNWMAKQTTTKDLNRLLAQAKQEKIDQLGGTSWVAP